MTLKEQMEKIWNERDIYFPNNLCRWQIVNEMWGGYVKRFYLVATKGERRVADPKKPELKWWQKYSRFRVPIRMK